jgi:hypothetical protein
LSTCTFAPEADNIRAAIEGYETGLIPYSTKWTVIYAGRIVDTCNSYGDFTRDRIERLKTYSDKYGEGWMWYEWPLRGREPIRAMGFTVLEYHEGSPDAGTGVYTIPMGFRRLTELVKSNGNSESKSKRVAQDAGEEDEGGDEDGESQDRDQYSKMRALLKLPKNLNKRRRLSPPIRLNRRQGKTRNSSQNTDIKKFKEDVCGPKMFFNMILDSGANLPCIYRKDVELLGIDIHKYAAQSYCMLNTVTTSVKRRLFDLAVTISTPECRSLVSETNPVWPTAPADIGGIVPVVMMEEQPPEGDTGPINAPYSSGNLSRRQSSRRSSKADEKQGCGSQLRADSKSPPTTGSGNRLSGILPFQTCYMSSAPGQHKIWLGEDRRDVLGANRMPGQLRYEAGTGRRWDAGHPREEWTHMKEIPESVRFSHRFSGRDEWLVDEDLSDRLGASRTVVSDASGRDEYIIEPRNTPVRQTANRAWIAGSYDEEK